MRVMVPKIGHSTVKGNRRGLVSRHGIIEGICFMYNNNSNGSRTASARGLMARWVVLAMALALRAWPAAAAPFAYIANGTASTVSVIDRQATRWWPRFW
jgi:hypothetical protein